MIQGFRLLPGLLDLEGQRALVATVLEAAKDAPFRNQTTPGGKAMSVANTSMGQFGWTSDGHGYRYEAVDPQTGRPWPPMPSVLLDLWREHASADVPPDSCLVNLYRGSAKLSLHQDKDEADFGFPVLSVSLGDTALFRLGGLKRSDPTHSFRLASGDACLLAGESRLAFHGVDRVVAGSSTLAPGGGRINLTVRRASPRPAG